MRSVTGNMQAKLDTALGSEPQIIVYVEWDNDPTFYSDGVIDFDGAPCTPAIISFTPLKTYNKQLGVGKISSASIVLGGEDLKEKWNRENFETIKCTVYQSYKDVSGSIDSIILLKGKIAPDIVWDESNHTLSFNIETIIHDEKIGYAPVSGDVTNLHKDAIGVAWPLCFGTVYKVPAIRIRKPTKGISQGKLNIDSTTILISDGKNFPSGSIDLRIGNILCTGSFGTDDDGNNTDLFTITTLNKPYYSSEAFAARVDGDAGADIAWINDASVRLVGKFCYVEHDSDYMVNYCINQDGAKCYFAKPWRIKEGDEDIFLDNTYTLIEACGEVHTDWEESYYIDTEYYHIDDSGDYSLQYYYPSSTYVKDSWAINSGTDVIESKAYSDMYVCNMLESTAVFEVVGYRTDIDGKKVLSIIPSSYYTKTLSNASVKTGMTITTLEFDIALEDYIGDNWEGNIYVSLVSTQGYNTAEIIKYLFDNYSTLSTDTTTFTNVAVEILNYPSCFALMEQYNVLDICEKIAWQARCAIYMNNETIYIRYLCGLLPDGGTADVSLDESKVKFKSIQLGFTPSENIITKLIAKWYIDYLPEETSEKTFIYEENIDTYGLNESENNFFIYNIESLVQLSAAFWGYRYANVWRQVTLKTFLKHLDTELFDIIALNITQVSYNSLIGVLQQVEYDSENLEINLSIELASRAGDVTLSDNQPFMDYFVIGATTYYTYFRGEEDYVIGPNTAPDITYENKEQDYLVEKAFHKMYTKGKIDTGGTDGPIIIVDKYTTSLPSMLDRPDIDLNSIKLSSVSTGKVVENIEGIEIPAYSVVEINDAAGTNGVIEVKRPTADNIDASQLMFIGAAAIAAGGKGLGYHSHDFSNKNTFDGAPAVNSVVGTQEDSFKLKDDKTGFNVQGVDGTEIIVRPKASSSIMTSRIRVYLDDDQVLANATSDKIDFDLESYDNLGEFADSKFTCTIDGRYIINSVCRLDIPNLDYGIYGLAIYKNAVLYSVCYSQVSHYIAIEWDAWNYYSLDTISLHITDILELEIDDEIEIYAIRSGGTLNGYSIIGGSEYSYLDIHQVS